MKKASFEITIKEKFRRLTFQLSLTHHLVTQNNLIKTDFQQRTFPSLQKLKNYLLQQNRRKRAAFLQVSVLKFIIVFSTHITLITIEDVRQRLSNTILNVLLPRCRFLTSLQISFRGIYYFEEKANQRIVNHYENKLTLFENKDNGLCKFIKSLTFANETISSQQIANLTLKPFTFLSYLSIINHNINNRVLYSFSKANWPNLSTLVLLVTENTADGLKILRKHSFFKMNKLMFKLELGQEASRRLTKVHVLKLIQIVPENFYLFRLLQESQILLNMKRSLFLKELVKSPLLGSEKYMNCKDLYALKYKMMSDGKIFRF